MKLPPEVEEKIKLLSSEVDKLRDELASSKAAVNSWNKMFKKDLLPMVRFINELAEMPEFEDLKKRMHEEKWKRLEKERLETLEAESKG